MSVSERFEDRLLHELRQIVADRDAPASVARVRSKRARLAWGGAGVVAASAVFAVVATTGDVTPSAYAVEPRADGAVTVSIHSLADAPGLQRTLRAAGVPAVVDFSGHIMVGCATAALGKDGKPVPPIDVAGSMGRQTTEAGAASQTDAVPGVPGTAEAPGLAEAGTNPSSAVVPVAATPVRVDGDGATFTIDPAAIKPGQTVYVTGEGGAVTSIGTAVSANEPAPVCPPAPAP